MVMNRVFDFNKVTWAFIAMIALVSCKSSMDVIPGSERIRVFESEPKGCLYVGEVSSVQENRSVGTLETEMTLDTRIDLRNKAHKLGGNILVFMKGKQTNTLPGTKVVMPTTKNGTPVAQPKPAPEGSTASNSAQDSSVAEPPVNTDTLIFLATVFKCPSSVLNQ